MAALVGRAAGSNGRARLVVHMAAGLRDRLARAAFEAGRPVSGLVEEAVTAALDAAEAPPPKHEAPRARWGAMVDGSWGATGAACPAEPRRGALVTLHGRDGAWTALVQVGGALWQGTPLRTRTAAMLEAEALAASITAEDVAQKLRAGGRRRRTATT